MASSQNTSLSKTSSRAISAKTPTTLHGFYVAFEDIESDAHEEFKKMIDFLSESGLSEWFSAGLSIYPKAVEDFFESARVAEDENSIIAMVRDKTFTIDSYLLASRFNLPITQSDFPSISDDDHRKAWALLTDKPFCKKSFRKSELSREAGLLIDLIVKQIDYKFGSYDVVSGSRFDIITAVVLNLKVNWAEFLFKKLCSLVVTKREGFGIQLSRIFENLGLKDIGSKTPIPSHRIVRANYIQRLETRPRGETYSKEVAGSSSQATSRIIKGKGKMVPQLAVASSGIEGTSDSDPYVQAEFSSRISIAEDAATTGEALEFVQASPLQSFLPPESEQASPCQPFEAPEPVQIPQSQLSFEETVSCCENYIQRWIADGVRRLNRLELFREKPLTSIYDMKRFTKFENSVLTRIPVSVPRKLFFSPYREIFPLTERVEALKSLSTARGFTKITSPPLLLWIEEQLLKSNEAFESSLNAAQIAGITDIAEEAIEARRIEEENREFDINYLNEDLAPILSLIIPTQKAQQATRGDSSIRDDDTVLKSLFMTAVVEVEQSPPQPEQNLVTKGGSSVAAEEFAAEEALFQNKGSAEVLEQSVFESILIDSPPLSPHEPPPKSVSPPDHPSASMLITPTLIPSQSIAPEVVHNLQLELAAIKEQMITKDTLQAFGESISAGIDSLATSSRAFEKESRTQFDALYKVSSANYAVNENIKNFLLKVEEERNTQLEAILEETPKAVDGIDVMKAQLEEIINLLDKPKTGEVTAAAKTKVTVTAPPKEIGPLPKRSTHAQRKKAVSRAVTNTVLNKEFEAAGLSESREKRREVLAARYLLAEAGGTPMTKDEIREIKQLREERNREEAERLEEERCSLKKRQKRKHPPPPS